MRIIPSSKLAEEQKVSDFINKSSPKVIIFGELHTRAERNRINRHIRKIHDSNGVDYILSEEVGPHEYHTRSQKEKAIRDIMYSTGPDSLSLSIELDVPIVGIDDWDTDFKMSTKDIFKVRETRMAAVISRYKSKGVVVVIIGDSHLRTIKTEELGDKSPILAIPNITIVRSPIGEIK